MEFLEILKSKEVDIYIALVVMILGLILGLIVDTFKDNKVVGASHKGMHITPVSVTTIIKLRDNQPNEYSGDEGIMFVIGFILFIAGAVYVFNRLEVLNSLYYLTVFNISLWSGGMIHNLLIGKFAGWRWFANLAFYCVFFVAMSHIVNKAITPNYAPTNFVYSQRLVNQNGLLGLSDYFSYLDFKWFMFHIAGVLLLFFSMILLILSTTYFAIMGNYVVSDNCEEPWLAKRTRKYAHFWSNIISISILLCVSYYFVAGNFFMWFEYEFPEGMKSFMSRALYGG